MRNIFVYNGRLAIITEYYKAWSRTNYAFYIICILPWLVSYMLFQYLVYI
ncbi:hypothetical protein BKA64DRAFT_585542 [Cadophora sp. MPI-SDFR-AT-0126]|nr:hypothetical protein BKA64DRAFT_585542 [Leotiomycetes sp. MPI-SDFR-AT-0126]